LIYLLTESDSLLDFRLAGIIKSIWGIFFKAQREDTDKAAWHVDLGQ
jgi:hypothetical protein